MEDNSLRYVFRTPTSISLDLAPKRTDKSNYTPNSRTSAETAPDSTVTKITRESQAVREDFRNSLAQLSQVHSQLSRENTEHVMRADVIMRDMDDMRKGLLEIQEEGRQNQRRLERVLKGFLAYFQLICIVWGQKGRTPKVPTSCDDVVTSYTTVPPTHL